MSDPTDEWISERDVRKRYGGISAMTLWRWDHDPKLGFPAPMEINGRKYRKRAELDAFDRSRVRRAPLSSATAATVAA